MLPESIEKDRWHDLGYILLKNRPSPNFWYKTIFFGPNYDRFCNFPLQKHFAKYTFKSSFDYLRLDTKVSISVELRSHYLELDVGFTLRLKNI